MTAAAVAVIVEQAVNVLVALLSLLPDGEQDKAASRIGVRVAQRLKLRRAAQAELDRRRK